MSSGRFGSIALMSAFVVIASVRPARASDMVICNNGTVTLKVATAEYSSSFLSGSSYHVGGWYNVDPKKCETVFSGVDNDVYLGFAFRDRQNILRIYKTASSHPSDQLQPTAERFCAGVGRVFDYTTRASGERCYGGEEPLEFSMIARFSLRNIGTMTYDVSPSPASSGRPLGDTADIAELLVGGQVHRSGRVWEMADGSLVPEGLIDMNTGMPPLAPRVQFQPTQAPVTGYLQQIGKVLLGVGPCRINSTMTSRLLDVIVDARGVAHSVREVGGASIGTETQEMALALGNVDFSQAKLINNKEFPDECWRLSLPARNGQWCAETSASGINTVGKSLGIDVNTVEQGSQILDLLKRIAASYPDAAPQLTRVNGG